MERDLKAPKQGYPAASLVKVLRKVLLRMYTRDMVFQQDNAGVYTAHEVRKVLQELGMRVMLWPPYSPYLNPIEHAWRDSKIALSEIIRT